MPKESVQKKLGRVRPPRVHITYDVEVGNAIETRQLPFVVGVLADLSGTPKEKPAKLADRRFTEIDSENFDEVLNKQAPRIVVDVPNTESKTGERLKMPIEFRTLGDFRPENVARKVPRLKELIELREKLTNLRSSLYGNEVLERALREAETKLKSEAAAAGENEA